MLPCLEKGGREQGFSTRAVFFVFFDPFGSQVGEQKPSSEKVGRHRIGHWKHPTDCTMADKESRPAKEQTTSNPCQDLELESQISHGIKQTANEPQSSLSTMVVRFLGFGPKEMPRQFKILQ